MKIVLLEPLNIPDAMLDKLAQPLIEAGHEWVAYKEKTTDPEEMLRRCQDADIVTIANTPFPASVVMGAGKLRLLNVAFTGIDHVALDACREKGITVCNAANYSNQTVAELVIGMTIALLRQTAEAQTRVHSGGTAAGLLGSEIMGKTVGIIGTGRIGMITAKLFQAFGARVIAYSRTKKPEAEALGIAYMPLEQLLAESDIVTLHTPNNPSTRRMLGKTQFALMKPTALFINCARGPIVDSQALADALNEGRIAGAAVDVFDKEPPIPQEEPLLHAQNTLLTPHIAFASKESMLRRAEIAFGNITAYLEGSPKNQCEY